MVVERELEEILAHDNGMRRQLSTTFALALFLLGTIAAGAWYLARDRERA